MPHHTHVHGHMYTHMYTQRKWKGCVNTSESNMCFYFCVHVLVQVRVLHMV